MALFRALWSVAALSALFWVSDVLSAQTTTRPTFEVASVKPSKSDAGYSFRVLPGGEFRLSNASVRDLVQLAYALQDFQVTGGPTWVNTDRFEILARSEDRTFQPGQFRMMLQALLAERFQFTAHRDSKELPVYALVTARADGRLGPQILPSGPQCRPFLPTINVRQPLSSPSTVNAQLRPVSDPNLPPRCGALFRGGHIMAREITMPGLATGLANIVRKSVVDRTGLSGYFDLDVEFTPEQQMPLGPPLPGAPPDRPIDPTGPSIYTALQEQLGLKLESVKGSDEILVIEHVEHPTEN